MIEDERTTASFTNTWLPVAEEPDTPTGTLALTKQVEGTTTDSTFSFTITLTGADGEALEGSYPLSGDVTGNIASGQTISLASGQTALISGLPAGTVYKAEEAGAQGYTASCANPEGTITAGTNKVTVVNTWTPVQTPSTQTPQQTVTEDPSVIIYEEPLVKKVAVPATTTTVTGGTSGSTGETPYTGDERDLTLYAVLTGTGLAGMVFFARRRRKGKQS